MTNVISYNCIEEFCYGKKLEIQAKKYRGESSIVSARIPIELVKVLDNVAEQTGRTRNEIMIMCLEFALNNIVISDSDGEN